MKKPEDKTKAELKALMESYEEQRCEIEDEITRINNAIANLNENIENANIVLREINDLTERKNIDLTMNEIEAVDEIYVDVPTGEYT